MHEDYRDQAVKELRDQLRFAPRAKKLQQAERAEKLLVEIEDKKDYAYDYLCYRITEYRPQESSRRLVHGKDIRHDLRLFVEDVSDAADVDAAEATEPVHTVDDLSRMFNVSTKTISRWRDQGLVSRRFVFDGRKRIGFLHSTVERFVAMNKDRVKRGERFTQLSDDEKGEMIERARQLASRGASLSEVTRRLSAQMSRSAETIRYTLKNFDKDNPSVSVFPNHRGALTEDDKRSIYQLSARGTSVSQLSKRYGRTASSIQRILVDMRAARIMELPLEYIYNKDFENSKLEEAILGPMPTNETPSRKVRVPAGLPSYLASLYDVPLLTREQEYHLFRKMNYLKHKANKLREQLERDGASSAVMDQIESLYELAVQTKNTIVQSNLRLVISIAKRHVGSNDDFFSLVSDGNMSLFRAVEKFDYARGNKFSTYASWSIIKNFARSIPDEFRHRDRFRTVGEEVIEAAPDDRKDPLAEESAHQRRQRDVNRILNRLDDREQQVISARFGLGRRQEPRTLKEVGQDLGVTRERIRQLEARALVKLRKAAAAEKIEIDI